MSSRFILAAAIGLIGLCSPLSARTGVPVFDGPVEVLRDYGLGADVEDIVDTVCADMNGDGLDEVIIMTYYDLRVVYSVGEFSFGGHIELELPPPVWSTSSSATPRLLVADDFDGDGSTDVIAARGDTTLLIRLAADGTFEQPIDLGFPSQHVRSADFNVDDRPDLYLATTPVGRVVLNSESGFSDPVDVFVAGGSDSSYSVGIGDYDADGDHDIITRLTTFLNDGSGVFTALSLSISPFSPFLSADLNSDGYADLIGRSQTISGPAIRLRNPLAPGYLPAQSLGMTVIASTWDVTTADVDGNGSVDIVFAIYPQAQFVLESGNVWVALGSGNGTFAPLQNYLCGGKVTMLTRRGHFSHDAADDLCTVEQSINFFLGADWLQEGSVQAVRCDPVTGPLAPAASPIMFLNDGEGPLGIDVADVGDADGDGDNDLSVNFNLSTKGAVAQNLGGVFSPMLRTYFAQGGLGGTARDSMLHQVDTDPAEELIGLLSVNGATSSSIVFFDQIANPNPSAYAFAYAASSQISGLPGQSFSFDVADLDGDGDDDFAVAARDTLEQHLVWIAWNNGDSTWELKPISIEGDRATRVRCADVEGDGDPDILASISLPVAGIPCDVRGAWVCLRNEGAGRFTENRTSDLSDITNIRTVDLDSDGDLDAVVATACIDSYELLIYENIGEANFALSATVPLSFQAADFLIRDLNEDGRFDIACGGYGYTPASAYHSIEFYLNNGNDGYVHASHFTGAMQSGLFWADFSGDGEEELAVTTTLGGAAAILYPRGFAPVTFGADLNSDCTTDFLDLDLLLSNWNSTVGPYSDGDADGDRDVDFDDLNVVLDAWGQRCE